MEEWKKNMMDYGDKTAFEDQFDYNFSVNETYIHTMEDLHEQLIAPLEAGHRMFYRGERVDSLKRSLLPTLFRDRDALIPPGKRFVQVDSPFLLDYYGSNGRYLELFNRVFGKADQYHLYDICAFSQHYMNSSPLIDFTKSPYVALSFALKGRETTDNDAIIYTVEITNEDNYTSDPLVAECWLREYRVSIYNQSTDEAGNRVQRTSPRAKIIDIATNDLMKYQQGLFLLLTDFVLVNRLYRTKRIRNDVNIVKHIVKKELCGDVTRMIRETAPWYDFDMLMDISSAVRLAFRAQRQD